VHKKTATSSGPIKYFPPEGRICVDEASEAVKMPEFNKEIATCDGNHEEIYIPDNVIEQVRNYVSTIASMYRNNSFHNFEHACHVTMSVKKLLKRVVTPELTEEQLEVMQNLANEDMNPDDIIAAHIHKSTYGINSEPHALLALTFSALIHDVDHPGVSNSQLANENPRLGEMYRNTSIAEQNSIDKAWDVLMQDQFSDLRECLFYSKEEIVLFRQLLVNMVLATDIFDKQLNDMRTSRWNKAFPENGDWDSNLRATVVLEHIIQASDVSHTMQHWQVYQKWNKGLFLELYKAFKGGRLAKDPAILWYKAELDFLDTYVIPLAMKLKGCGVFGVSGDEYLSYAMSNRSEWTERGQEIVRDLVASVSE